MSKRDDDPSQSDMEVGMTTAERRRRRRRGGGLRVPSDNVPRRTSPPVVAPVPEDPSLAMSIAYSFTSDGSEPVRTTLEQTVPAFDDPVAPEAMPTLPTVIDPPSAPVEQADFETKTREMTAVDLEALGLADPSARPASAEAVAPEPAPARVVPSVMPPVLPEPPPLDSPASADDLAARLGRPRRTSENPPLDKEVVARPASASEPPAGPASAPISAQISVPVIPPSGPVAIPAVPAPVTPSASGPVAVPPPAATPTPVAPSASGPVVATPPRPTQRVAMEPLVPTVEPAPPTPAPHRPRERLKTVALSDEDLEEVREAVARAQSAAPTPAPAPRPALGVNATQPLSVLDIEVDERPQEGSLPEIDINELAERADTSGEYEVDIDEGEQDDAPAQAAQTAQAPAATPPPPTPAGDRRSRPPSVPPPQTPAASTSPAPSTPTPTSAPASPAQPPPPPPVAHKTPPTPPPKAKAAVAPTPAKAPEGKGARAKAWFVDLFDEDYLRTLPFLTPQATQHEAEFVIESMGLAPGAQVLDVGCGYGRHAMELAARGFHVVGLDLSTPLLVRGGEEATRRGLDINFVRGDMRELEFDAQFDGAYCMFSTFGYFDDETNKKTLVNIARALKPGGRLIIEILNRDYVIADLPTRVWWEGDGCVVLEEVELNYFSSRIQVNRSVVFDDGRQVEQEISVRAYSLHEVGKLMHAAGFRVLEVSGGYHTRGRFFGNQSRHIIVLAERKETTTG